MSILRLVHQRMDRVCHTRHAYGSNVPRNALCQQRQLCHLMPSSLHVIFKYNSSNKVQSPMIQLAIYKMAWLFLLRAKWRVCLETSQLPKKEKRSQT